jgi:hypothetical protein
MSGHLIAMQSCNSDSYAPDGNADTTPTSATMLRTIFLSVALASCDASYHYDEIEATTGLMFPPRPGSLETASGSYTLT